MTTPEAIGMLSGLLALLITIFKVISDKEASIDPTGLIKPLREEIERLRDELRAAKEIQRRLVQAIFDNLNERQDKLKNNPGCASCLGADVIYRQQIQAIVINGNADKTQPIKS